jgi:hypothetical protein
MRRIAPVTLSALLFTSLALAQTTSKPDFSGTWKLNVGKSDFGPMPAPQSRTDKIEHREPALRHTTTQAREEGEGSFTINLSTDGKEAVNTVNGREARSVARWEGDSLVIESKFEAGGSTVTIKDKWALSADGKALTIARHYSGPEGEADATLVLERQ